MEEEKPRTVIQRHDPVEYAKSVRATGRSTRMLREALKTRACDVLVVGSCRSHVDGLYLMAVHILEQSGEIVKCRLYRATPQITFIEDGGCPEKSTYRRVIFDTPEGAMINWVEMTSDRWPGYATFVDHWAIEVRFMRMIEQMHKFDE